MVDPKNINNGVINQNGHNDCFYPKRDRAGRIIGNKQGINPVDKPHLPENKNPPPNKD